MMQEEGTFELITPKEDLERKSTRQLLFDHFLIHSYFDKFIDLDELPFDWTLENLSEIHDQILEELSERKDTQFKEDLNHSFHKFKDKLSEYGIPMESRKKQGKKIFLKEILDNLQNLKIAHSYVYLIGEATNQEGTEGNINFLIKKSPPMIKCPKCNYENFDHSADMILKFKIMRSFPKELWNRIHFFYNDLTSNKDLFTNLVPVYDLLFERQKDEETPKETFEIELGKPYVFNSPKKFFKQEEFFNFIKNDHN